jgi:twitching motility two-component system response regulator PilH
MSDKGPLNARGSKPLSAARANTLGLDDKALVQALEVLDRSTEGHVDEGAAKRVFVRWPFRLTSLPIEIVHPGGTKSALNLACRNLSCGGCGVLHNSFVHPGARCRVTLPHPSRGPIEVQATVVRCTHRAGVVHELGIRFDAPISARDFVRPDPLTDFFSLEKVKGEDLRGAMVVVEDTTLDQQIFKHFFRETQLRIRFAATGAEGIKLAQSGCDLVLADFHLPDMNAAALVTQLRAQNVHVPVIVVSCDQTPQTRDLIRRSNADAFLSKPVSEERVLRAVAEFLLAEQAGNAGNSMKKDSPKKFLVESFLEELPKYSAKFNELLKTDDAMAAYVLCQQIAGTAPTLGFDGIAALAEKTALALARTMSVKESARAVQELISACERTRSLASR